MKLIIICAFIFHFQIFSQKSQISVNFPLNFPIKSTMPYMNSLNGICFGGGFRPITSLPMLIDCKLSFGTYAQKKGVIEDLFKTFPNSHEQFKNNFNKFILGSKWFIGNEENLIRFYITPQIGLAFFSAKTIYAYTYQRKTKSYPILNQLNGGGIYSIEMGSEILLNKIFTSLASSVNHRIILSFNLTNGFKPFTYSNINNEILDSPPTNSNYVTLKNRHINTPNKYTSLHSSNLKMWGISIGYIFNFD